MAKDRYTDDTDIVDAHMNGDTDMDREQGKDTERRTPEEKEGPSLRDFADDEDMMEEPVQDLEDGYDDYDSVDAGV